MKPCNDSQRKMEHGQICIGSNFPANKQSSKTIHPRVGALAHPAARLLSSASLQLLGPFAPRTNVSGEIEFIRQLSDLVIVVAFVEAEILRGFWRRFGSANRDAFERLPRHFEVVPVGALDGEAHWNATRFDQDTSLGSQLGPVGRIGAGFFPHPAEPWSSLRPWTATSSRCLSPRHRPRGLVSRIPRRRPPPATLGSAGRRTSTYKSRWRRERSTGNRCGAQREWHSLPLCLELGGCDNRAGARDAEAAMAPSAPTTRPEFSSRRLSKIGPCRRMRHVCSEVRFSAIPAISARNSTDHFSSSDNSYRNRL